MAETSLSIIDGTGAPQKTAQDIDSSGFMVPRHSLTYNGVPLALANPLPVSVIIGTAAAGSSNGVPTIPPPATPVSATTLTITTANVGQVLFAAGTIGRGYRVQNPSAATESVYIDDSGSGPSLTAGTTIEIQPGGYYESAVPPTAAVMVMAATAGHAFRAARW